MYVLRTFSRVINHLVNFVNLCMYTVGCVFLLSLYAPSIASLTGVWPSRQPAFSLMNTPAFCSFQRHQVYEMIFSCPVKRSESCWVESIVDVGSATYEYAALAESITCSPPIHPVDTGPFPGLPVDFLFFPDGQNLTQPRPEDVQNLIV